MNNRFTHLEKMVVLAMVLVIVLGSIICVLTGHAKEAVEVFGPILTLLALLWRFKPNQPGN